MKIAGYSFYEMKFVKIDYSGTIRIRLDLGQAGLMVSLNNYLTAFEITEENHQVHQVNLQICFADIII